MIGLIALVVASPGWPNVLVDRDGGVIVAWCDRDRGDVVLSRQTAAGAQEEIVDSKGAVGKYLTAAMGEDGPELVYLDQGRRTLRYARVEGSRWKIEDILHGEGEIGVGGRFLIGPRGERVILHYDHAFDLLVTYRVGKRWATDKLARAAGTYQSRIGAFWEGGALWLSFPDQTIGAASLHTAVLRFESGAMRMTEGEGMNAVVPESDRVGADIYYMSRHREDDELFVGPTLSSAVKIADEVQSFRVVSVAGTTVVALTTNQRLELMWQNESGWQRVLVASGAIGEFSAGSRGGTVELAYVDRASGTLKHARLDLFAPVSMTSR